MFNEILILIFDFRPRSRSKHGGVEYYVTKLLSGHDCFQQSYIRWASLEPLTVIIARATPIPHSRPDNASRRDT